MPQFKGTLATPIARLRPSILSDSDEAIAEEHQRALTERLDKVPALAQHYGITGKLGYAQILLLLLALASETVPGFMFDDSRDLRRAGAPKKHDNHSLFLLLLRVEALRLEGMGDEEACQAIAEEDNPTKYAGPANRSDREKRGKTLQNLLSKARSMPFASGVRKLTEGGNPEN